jgi:hypothetical protein
MTKKPAIPIRVLKDGREIINLLCREGHEEYERRKRAMLARQNGICCLHRHIPSCPGKLYWKDVMFEHQDGRGLGGGHRDDRIERPDPKTGEMKPYNGVAHAWCNSLKGSRRIDYTGFYSK